MLQATNWLLMLLRQCAAVAHVQMQMQCVNKQGEEEGAHAWIMHCSQDVCMRSFISTHILSASLPGSKLFVT